MSKTNTISASIPTVIKGLVVIALLLSCEGLFAQNVKGQTKQNAYTNKLQPSEHPVISSAPLESVFCTIKGDCGSTHTTLVTSANDDRTPADHLIYTFKIDLESDGEFEKHGEGSDASGQYPLGTHRIEWFVQDESGNISTSKYEFTIRDCQPPKAHCINGKSIELASKDATTRVWASELDLSSMDNCGISELRIASPSAGPGQSVPPPPGDYVEFDCSVLGVQSVDVWVKDEGNNWDYCTTYLHVADRRNFCKPGEKAAASATVETSKTAEQKLSDPKLEINSESFPLAEGFQLYQNFPNPFEERTTISFHLPESSTATLTIYDLTGKVLKTINGAYSKGFHQIELKKSDLAGSSVLYYQLDTDIYSASMKMLLVD